MAPRLRTSVSPSRAAHAQLGFNPDAVAILIALTLAALVRLNIIHSIGW